MSDERRLTLEPTPESIAFARRATELLADRPAGGAPISLRIGGENAPAIEIPGPVHELLLRTLALAAEGWRSRLVEGG